MEIVAATLVIVLILGVMLAGGVESWNHYLTFRESYARLAGQFGGTVTPGRLFQRSRSVRFVHRGAPVLVDTFWVSGNGSMFFTQVRIQWPDARLRCEIHPATGLTRIGRLLGMESMATGSADFDKSFQVSGNDVESIRELLSPDVRETLQALRNLEGNDEIYLAFGGGSMLVRKYGAIREFDALVRLTTLVLTLFDLALPKLDAGIEFMDQPIRALDAPICQVCCDPITTDRVQCRSCKTAHHKECWIYYGACSTYGCGEKRFTTLPNSTYRKAS